MAQGHDKLFPPNTGETFANFAAKARANQSAMNTLHSGASAPTTPEDRQLWLDTSISPNVLKIYDQASATWKTMDFLDVLIKEVVDARGTASKLDARLDQALNEDGTLKASTTLNPDEFKAVTGTPTRTSATVFTKVGDQSAIYTVNRRVKMTPGPNYSRVTAVSFAAGTTTVTVADSNVPVGITAADVGIIDPTAGTTGVDAKGLASPSGGVIEDYIATDIIRARRGLAALLQDFDQDPATTTGLTWGFKSGLLPDGTLKASGTIALTASATNFVEIDPAAGTVSTNTTGFTSGKVPLRQVVTDATSQTSSIDKRPFIQRGGGVGSYRALGIDCKNNATTPNTQFDLDADVVTLRDSNNNIVVRHDPGAAITNNISTAGPAANGRDQAGAFAASSWIHFYWIWNGTTLATISSTFAPPTGPTLPTGYTHWAYAGAVRNNATPILVKTRIKGAWAHYEDRVNVLSGGAATAETTISVSTAVPPNALTYQLSIDFRNTDTTAARGHNIRVITGTNHLIVAAAIATAAIATQFAQASIILPNISQQHFYINDVSAGTVSHDITGYQLPNGGE